MKLWLQLSWDTQKFGISCGPILQQDAKYLIIGNLADSRNIDPIVVSSCIFMEDERSETQVDGIVNKVNQ